MGFTVESLDRRGTKVEEGTEVSGPSVTRRGG